MNIYAAIYTYERPNILRECLKSVFAQTLMPGRIDIIDNASGWQVDEVIRSYRDKANIIKKPQNMGAGDSGRIALETCRRENPDYFIQIESDYIFRTWAFGAAIDIMEHTTEGQMALGVVGYDAPNYYSKEYTEGYFPNCMKQQVGEDNVNRAILHKPFKVGYYTLEFVSNTHPTCYLNWKRLQMIAYEFPELNDLLDQIYSPRENPNYPTSAIYRDKKYIDDGMLSHAISLCWNRWAIKHGVDRDRYAAWINVKPSLAQNVNGGGEHTNALEGQSDNPSPSWI